MPSRRRRACPHEKHLTSAKKQQFSEKIRKFGWASDVRPTQNTPQRTKKVLIFFICTNMVL
jgi:hypothetical protein